MKVIIVGAGPAAAGVALALTTNSNATVRVLDIGGRLEPENDEARARMSSARPKDWAVDDIRSVSHTAVVSEQHRIPEKRNFGSDFPFRNFGQLDGLSSEGGVNSHVISGAYGGFSNTWGAQAMVFSDATFDDWPFSRGDLESDYRAILSAIPYSGEEDDLSEYFPLWGPAQSLPPLSEGPDRVLSGYERHRLRVRRQGVLLGKARLAFKGGDCVSCGLCMTGCPYSFVYSASQTFDDLIRNSRIDYTGGFLALHVGEEDGRPFVAARSLATGGLETFRADKVFVATGALGTTRLVAQSLGMWSRRFHMKESAQFLVPLLALRGIKDLSQEGTFTLNQFNMVMPFDESGHDIVQIHGYPYNEAMDDSLPAFLSLPAFRGLSAMLLRRLTVGLGYLPSWWSPGFDVSIDRPGDDQQIADMTLFPSTDDGSLARRNLRAVTRKLVMVAPSLGVFPVLSQIAFSAPGKSYHYGGSFPHSRTPKQSEQTDIVGRLYPWRNIHLADASVFPTVPATTFTLSIMANAHRIARSVLQVDRG
ncbi:MAG: GMC oxidoreductase [Acidimicrobiales bacterium]